MFLSLTGAQCPTTWVQKPGVCMWPKQQAYKTIDVSGAASEAGACCAACASEQPKCVSWLVFSAKKSSYPAGSCILNNATVEGTAPPESICTSGVRPAATWPPTPAPKPAPKNAKNVLFFAVDDLRPEITAFGPVPGTVQPKMHTPHLDALAAKSLVLTKNYVQQAVCSPTRQSLLTGRRPDRTRVYDLYVNFRTVAANYTTIPEHFLHNGYETIGMGKIFHPGHASGAAPGMGGGDDLCCSWSNKSFYYHAPNGPLYTGTNPNAAGLLTGGKAWMSVSPELEAQHALPDNQTADNAIASLERLARRTGSAAAKPWFLAVGFHKPHLPFVASQQFFDLYPTADVALPPDQQPPAGMPEIAWSSYGELLAYSDQKSLNASGDPGTVLPKDDVVALRRAYYASVSQTDAMVGRVMAALAASPFASNTVISLWGDHGWQLGEHGEWCKHTNFELAARAPMMVHVPGLTNGGVVTAHYSEHVDLLPTLSEAAMGIAVPLCPYGDASFKVALCTEGSSLVPLMKDPSTPVKLASFSQYPRGYVHPALESGASAGSVASFDAAAEGIANFFYERDGETASTSQCIVAGGKGCTMGYTVATRVDGHEYRYTEWADFNTKGFPLKVNWERNVGVELYNHSADPGENFNINATQKGDAVVVALSAHLSALLRKGPTYGTQI
jgi:iduronate 2-sulfatase